MPIHNFDYHLGVDMTGSEQKTHFRHLENLWRRHGDEGGRGESDDTYGIGRALERTPGFRRLLTVPDRIHSLFQCESDNSLFIHAGKRLYRLTAAAVFPLPEDEDEEERRRTTYAPAALLRLTGQTSAAPTVYLTDFLPERPIAAAEVGDRLYFADGVRLYCYAKGRFTAVADAGTLKIGDVTVTSLTEPYVPLRTLDGVEYEQRNLLTDRYRQVHTFRENDALNCGNAPIHFVRTGTNEEGVATCRAEFCLTGDFGDTLVIPPSTVIDGITCAVTEVSQYLFSPLYPYTTVVFPHTFTCIPEAGIVNVPDVHTVRLPIGVNEVNMSFFNAFSRDLLIEYEGNESQWSKVQLKTDGYVGKYEVQFGYSERLTTYGIPLCEASASVGLLTLDGKPVENRNNDRFHFYPIRINEPVEAYAPYTHIYILARTPITLTGRTLTVSAGALPFRYQSEAGTHALGTTEGALKELGIETGNASASESDVPEGQALLRGCRLLASYDRRLFFSGLPAIPDVIFYSHEDADGNPDPTYVAAMNYMTDSDRMAVTGLYSASGELCVTHASGTRGKLVSHVYDLPDQAHSLFLRLYPVKAAYSVGRVISASVFEGRLHLLTEDGIFAYTRTSADGYLKAYRVSGRITPVIRSIGAKKTESPPFFASLGSRLALFDGSDLYFGDSVLTEGKGTSQEYEWYPQSSVGSYTGDTEGFFSCEEVPPSLRSAFFLGANYEQIPLVCEDERKSYQASEVESKTAKTFEDGFWGEVTVYCAKASGALVDTLGYRVGGTLDAPTSAVRFGSLLVFGTESGALLTYNTDLDGDAAGEAYYLTDGHRTTALLRTFAENGGARAVRKRIRAGTSYLFLRPMAGSAPTLTVQNDGREHVLRLAAAPFEFDRLEFDRVGFLTGDTAAFPIPEHEDHMERCYTLTSDTPFAFLGLHYTYDVRK